MTYVPLEGQEQAALATAVVAAFPSKAALKMALTQQMNVRLDVVAGGDNLAQIVGNLLEWSDSNERTPELVGALRRANSRNGLLRDFDLSYAKAREASAAREPARPSGPPRDEIVAALRAIPRLQDPAERDALVRGVQGADALARVRHDTYEDLTAIVDGLLSNEGALKEVLRRAANDARGYNATLAARLDQLAGGADADAGVGVYGGRFAGGDLEELTFDGEDARLTRPFIEGAFRYGRAVARLRVPRIDGGGAQQYALRNNFFQKRSDDARLLWYLTDTMPGASGSPVCDDRWEVVAVHHPAEPAPALAASLDGPPRKVARFWNEGVDVVEVVAWLQATQASTWAEIAASQTA